MMVTDTKARDGSRWPPNAGCPSTPAHSLRLQRGTEHLHVLGARVISEFLREVGEANGCWPQILDLLDAYRTRLTLEMVRAVGADRFPPRLRVAPR